LLSSARGPVSSSTHAISTAASSSNGSGLTAECLPGPRRGARDLSRSSRGWRCAVHPRVTCVTLPLEASSCTSPSSCDTTRYAVRNGGPSLRQPLLTTQ
jgi:hypothetical protein